MVFTFNRHWRGLPPPRSVCNMATAFLRSTAKTLATGAVQVSKNVRGGLGEPVTIKVERAGSEAPLYYTIVRDAVPLPTIRNSYMIRPGTGYIGLTGGFQRSSDDELRQAIKNSMNKECGNLFSICVTIREAFWIRPLTLPASFYRAVGLSFQ